MRDLLFAGDQTLYLILVLSAIPISVATAVGLIVALIQAVTHLQEQTLPFGLKLLAVCVCMYLVAGWMGTQLLRFGDEMLRLAFR